MFQSENNFYKRLQSTGMKDFNFKIFFLLLVFLMQFKLFSLLEIVFDYKLLNLAYRTNPLNRIFDRICTSVLVLDLYLYIFSFNVFGELFSEVVRVLG